MMRIMAAVDADGLQVVWSSLLTQLHPSSPLLSVPTSDWLDTCHYFVVSGGVHHTGFLGLVQSVMTQLGVSSGAVGRT